jgi:exodeoxyribonuclease V alpha subunit
VDQAVANAAAQGLDRQRRQAVAALLRHGLVLLGGGPGTGKTSTVVQMLGAVLAQRPGLRLHLAAPTGKAAARLRTTLQEGGQRLAPPLADQLGQAPCTTLHRLLESSGDRFGRNRRHPLALDLVVVDELSMVDLHLMAALLEALPQACQLLLVGDPAQLPPVGPGAVLQELCQSERLAALGEAAIALQTTYRNNGAIAAFAAALRPGGQQAWGQPQRSDPLIGPQPEEGLPRPRQAPSADPSPTPSPTPSEAPAPAGAATQPAAGLATLLKGLKPDANLIWQPHPAGRLPAEALERLDRHRQRLQALAEAIDWQAWDARTRTGSNRANRISPPAPADSPDGATAGAAPDAPGPDPAAALLAELEACVVLSPVRQGAWGVEAVHRQLLGEAASQPIQHWPLGTPVPLPAQPGRGGARQRRYRGAGGTLG